MFPEGESLAGFAGTRVRMIKKKARYSRPNYLLDQTGPEFEFKRFPGRTFRP